MLQDASMFRRGYLAGSCTAAVVIVLVWSGVLGLQLLQAHRVPVRTTQYQTLEAFPETAFIVVSKRCVPAGETPQKPPLFDFASISDFRSSTEGEPIISVKRPAPGGVLWQQKSYKENHGDRGEFTCAITTGGFSNEKMECLERSGTVNNGWKSSQPWQGCKSQFDPVVGFNVGNWSVTPLSKGADQTQRLPSWPSETFFFLPVPDSKLDSYVMRVHKSIEEVVKSGTNFATVLSIQEALSARFHDGVWLFQAFNSDPFANIGPSMVRLKSSRCEGECEAGTSSVKLSATLEKASPKWRQPLCNPAVRHISEHQGCVPIVVVADLEEAVVISSVAFRWPNLFAQWLSPLIAFALVLPAVLFMPCNKEGGENGSMHEGQGLMNSPGKGEGSERQGSHVPQIVGMGRTAQLDDEL
mmetsp:Transcript_20767/g.45015  ORF Transcript_20767/g.45015 Transcript_20767/m.45015 type:complete len:413 (+) Transcript_20767:304-1542(+)